MNLQFEFQRRKKIFVQMRAASRKLANPLSLLIDRRITIRSTLRSTDRRRCSLVIAPTGFSKLKRRMVHVWESISMSVDNGVEKEVNEDVCETSRVIHVEYVHAIKVVDMNLFIRFGDIENSSSPTADTIQVLLETSEIFTFRFGTKETKNDFYEAITIVSSGNSDG